MGVSVRWTWLTCNKISKPNRPTIQVDQIIQFNSHQSTPYRQLNESPNQFKTRILDLFDAISYRYHSKHACKLIKVKERVYPFCGSKFWNLKIRVKTQNLKIFQTHTQAWALPIDPWEWFLRGNLKNPSWLEKSRKEFPARFIRYTWWGL